MQSRRTFLKQLYLLGAGALFSCKPKTGEVGGKMYRSTIDDIKPKLTQMITTFKQKGFDIDEKFKPGLSKEEILKKTGALSFAIPPEIVELYTWRNGTLDPWYDSTKPLLIFRDYSFVDLDHSLETVSSIKQYYGVKNVFPFATFQEGSLVIPVKPFSIFKNIERPIISIHQGTELYFYSFSTMLDTVIEWIEKDVNRPYDYESLSKKADLELDIWQKHNPGFREFYDIL